MRNKYLCNEIDDDDDDDVDDDDDDDDDGDIDAKEIPMMPMILMMTSRIWLVGRKNWNRESLLKVQSLVIYLN